MGPSTSPVWMKVVVVSLTTTPTSVSNQPTAVPLGATPIPAHHSQDRVLALSVTSPSCFPIWVATGGMKVGVNLLHSTMLFTWSMPSTALAVILATSFTFGPLTAV